MKFKVSNSQSLINSYRSVFTFKIKFYVFFILSLWLGENTAFSQTPWIGTKFTIDYSHPVMFYWDTSANSLYIGGDIYSVNSQKVRRLFKIDSNENVNYMDTIKSNMEFPMAMIKYEDTLFYVGSKGLYYLVNDSWEYKISSSLFQSIVEYDNKLVLGGYFKNAISSWDGVAISYENGSFQPFEDIYPLLGDTINFGGASIYAMEKYQGSLYLAGNFSGYGNGKYNEIISWDGSNWSDLREGIKGNSGNESISDLLVYKNELYVAGRFTTEFGSPSNLIMKWDGNNWITLGNGVYGSIITEMVIYNDDLWVFGAIDSVDNLKLSNVGIWNGVNWCSPGGVFERGITCAGVFNQDLYIGGNFRDIDGDTTIQRIAKLGNDTIKKCGKIVKQTPLSVPESLDNEKDLKIYPNPSNGKIIIEKLNETDGELSIVNIQGMEVYNQKLPSGMKEIILILNKGIYIVRFQNGTRNSSSKVLVW